MKQGIVMEIRNKHAIVLTKDGTFERISLKKGQPVEIGSEIDVPAAKPLGFSRAQRVVFSFASVAAILLLVFTQLPLLKQSNLAVAAYVSLDINPSLEVGVSETLNVVEVIPINEDGQKIVDQMEDGYRGKALAEFVDYTMELAEEDGYLKENKDVLLTTTTINKKAEGKLEKNLNEIKKEIENDGVAVATLKGDEKSRKEAKDLGVSLGKYLIYKESKESLSIEETKDLSVTQIYKKLEEKKNTQPKETIKPKDNKEEQKFDNKNEKKEKKDFEGINGTHKNDDKNKNSQEIKPTGENKTNKNHSSHELPPSKGTNQGKNIEKQQKKFVETDKRDRNIQGPKENYKYKPEEKNNEHGNNYNLHNEKNNGNKKTNRQYFSGNKDKFY